MAKVNFSKNNFHFKIDFRKVSNFILYNLFFIITWSQIFANKNSVTFIVIFSLVIHLIVRTNLKAYLASIIGISFLVALLQFRFFQNFYQANSILNLIFSFFLFTGIAAFCLKYIFIETDLDQKENLILNGILALISTFFIRGLEPISNSVAFKVLIPTGEDNASWLHGLASGMSSTEYAYSLQSNEGGGTLTGVISTLFRSVITVGNPNYSVVDNTSTLFRLYVACFLVVIYLVANFSHIAINFLTKPKALPTYWKIAAALTSAFVSYLCLSSYAMFGHLTPIESLIGVFATFAIISLSLENFNLSNFKKLMLILLQIVILLAASRSWYPLTPIFVSSAFMLILSFFYQKLNKWILFGFVTFFIFLYILKVDFLNSKLSNIFAKLLSDVHMPGGTTTPSTISLLILLFGIISIYSSGIRNTSIKNNLIHFDILTFNFFGFYAFIILISITTPPFSIDYAGSKLGLFLISTFLPFLIIGLFIKFARTFRDLFHSFVFILCLVLITVFIGPPTGPSVPGNTQFGFPFVVTSSVRSGHQTFPDWSDSLLARISQSNNKAVLCLDSRQGGYNNMDSYGCSRFASGIQGLSNKPGIRSWWKLNLNSISLEDLKRDLPSDFFEKTEILYFDPSRKNSEDETQIILTSIIPN